MMLRSVCIVMILVQATFVIQAHAKQPAINRKGEAQGSTDNLVDQLAERSPQIWRMKHADLEETTLGKPGHLATPHTRPYYSRPGVQSSRIASRSVRAAASPFYSLAAKDIDGNEVPFSKFQGKPVLIGNVASK